MFDEFKTAGKELYTDILDLKDGIRDTFSDQLGKWWVRLLFVFAALPVVLTVFWFMEVGHAWVNVFKEEMVKRLHFSESMADAMKYPVSFTAAAIAFILLEWLLTRSFL